MSKFSYYQHNFLNEMRHTTDPLADEVVEALFHGGFNPLVEESYATFQSNSQPIPEAFPEVLRQYFTRVSDEAALVDKDLTQAGSRLFQQHAPSLMAMLGALSLPYCYASGDGVQVLYLSKRIKDNPGKRLLETAAFVLDVCSPGAFEPAGKALRSIAKVRLMHAAIRYYTNKSGSWKGKWGKPINQEDMAGTNLAFSLIAIRGLRKMGHPITVEQAWNYLKLWNVVGKLMGIREELLPGNNREAFFLEKQIRKRTFYATPEGQTLTQSLVNHLTRETKGELPVSSLMYYLMGEEVAKLLNFDQTKSKKGMIGVIKVMNQLQSLRTNDSAYLEIIAAYNLQQIRLKKNGVLLKPFRLVSGLSD